MAAAFSPALGCATALRADGNWTALTSDHFRVLCDLDAGAVARELPRIESALAGIAARVRPNRPLPARIDVLWLRHQDHLEALGVTMARGYYLPHQGDEPSTPPLVVVAGTPGRDVEQALVHELAHVLFVDAAPGAPPWLAEGMAAWWGSIDLERGTVGFDDIANGERMIASTTGMHGRLHYGLDILHTSYRLFHESMMAAWYYERARALVAMLVSEPDLSPRFDAYLARLRAGELADPAWSESFGDVPALDERFDRFYTGPRTRLPLVAWHGGIATAREPAPVVERWLARARPWDSPRALAEAGRALARAAGDDSAERHYWSGVFAATEKRWSDAVGELRAALARDPSLTAARSALARIEALRRP